MPFASFSPTNPWNFHKKISWIGDFEKLSVFESAILIFFREKKCIIPMKLSHNLCARMDGTHFLWLWWFTAKNHSPQTFQPAVYLSIRCLTYSTLLCWSNAHSIIWLKRFPIVFQDLLHSLSFTEFLLKSVSLRFTFKNFYSSFLLLLIPFSNETPHLYQMQSKICFFHWLKT